MCVCVCVCVCVFRKGEMQKSEKLSEGFAQYCLVVLNHDRDSPNVNSVTHSQCRVSAKSSYRGSTFRLSLTPIKSPRWQSVTHCEPAESLSGRRRQHAFSRAGSTHFHVQAVRIFTSCLSLQRLNCLFLGCLTSQQHLQRNVYLAIGPGAGITEADDRQVTTVFTVQPSFHHRHLTNRVS